MSDPPKASGPQLVPTGIAELHAQSETGRFVATMSGMPTLSKDSVRGFSAEGSESLGFKFLAEFGPRAVRAFKLLAVAQSKTGPDGSEEISENQLALLTQLIGGDFVALAIGAYADCKEITYDLGSLADLDAGVAWRLTEFVHLFENVMAWGQRQGTLQKAQAAQVLAILVRDFGAYYGLLVDDVAGTRREAVSILLNFLRVFQQSPHFSRDLPLDKMTRLPLQAPLSVNLLDYEIARGIEAHPMAVNERILRGDEHGNLTGEDPVQFTRHQLTVFYSRELDAEGRAIVNAILPLFAISAFAGFSSLAEVEAFLARRRQVIQQAERECFALLQCLQHYGGRVPPAMKEFRAADALKAAQRGRRQREREDGQKRKRATTAGGMLRETLEGAVQALTRPITFSWPADRQVFQLAGYPENVAFFPQQVAIRNAQGGDDVFAFLCHARRDRDPDLETPLMFEYQAVLGDSQLFDTHAALRDGFANVPDTFRRTIDAGPVVLFAKETVFASQTGADTEEVKLLGTYVALNGGMKSWVGQHYLLSRDSADVFIRYPDVRDYLSRLLPG